MTLAAFIESVRASWHEAETRARELREVLDNYHDRLVDEGYPMARMDGRLESSGVGLEYAVARDQARNLMVLLDRAEALARDYELLRGGEPLHENDPEPALTMPTYVATSLEYTPLVFGANIGANIGAFVPKSGLVAIESAIEL